MNATCPRCGTVTLIGAQARYVKCKTCGLRYCRECQHWKIDRKQNYCANCGAMFSIPPPMMPPRLYALVLYTPYLIAILLLPLIRLTFWHMALAVILLPLVYTLAYIVAFYRRTGLVRAAWREAAILARRALTLAAMIYIVLMGSSSTSLIAGLILIIVLVAFALVIRRNDVRIIQELQANHHIWQAILSMSNRDAFLMRFPQVRTIG